MKAVTIMLHDDGSFMVSEEEMDETMDGGGGGETFASADEACAAALSMLRGEGASPEEADAAMQDGYDSVAGNRAGPAPGGGGGVSAMFGE